MLTHVIFSFLAINHQREFARKLSNHKLDKQGVIWFVTVPVMQLKETEQLLKSVSARLDIHKNFAASEDNAASMVKDLIAQYKKATAQ